MSIRASEAVTTVVRRRQIDLAAATMMPSRNIKDDAAATKVVPDIDEAAATVVPKDEI